MDLDEIYANADDDAAQDRVEEVIATRGWPVVRDHALAVLEDPDRAVAAWQLAAAVLWCGCDWGHGLPVARTIALVYARLPPDEGSGESNLAWSIAARLRGVDYLSAYDPLADAEVTRELATIARPARRDG